MDERRCVPWQLGRWVRGAAHGCSPTAQSYQIRLDIVLGDRLEQELTHLSLSTQVHVRPRNTHGEAAQLLMAA